ncbi:phosphoribosyl-ATP pyrophosphohydrolase [Candidatus Dependentiae bacterium]|nr:phosphoribosyl-ATP pyrophosphohydrolase [Candidatus Dependentiae bacterium]
MYRKFVQNKLWRDKGPEMLAGQGSFVDAKILTDAEFAFELKNKIQEEVDEVKAAKNKEELIEELADVFEVAAAFGSLYQFSLQDIMQVQEKKRQERGGFETRTFVKYAYHKIGSPGEAYCLKEPAKYPEVECEPLD